MVAKQKRLGEMLIEAGLITEVQLRGALARQKQWGGRLGTNLVKLGNIKEEELGRFLAKQTGVSELNISKVVILPHILKLVPKKIAEKYHLVPIAMKDKNTLIVACADPTDLGALDHISFLTGHKVEPVLSSYAMIRDAIDRHYPGGTTLTGKESVLVDDTMPSLMDLSDLSGHGGHLAAADPGLIIFGEQTALSAERQSLAATPAATPRRHQFITEPPRPDNSQEFTLDFNPDWAQRSEPPRAPFAPTAPPLRQPVQPSRGPSPLGRPEGQHLDNSNSNPTVSKSSASSSDQKLKVLLRLLIKKGLITEEELRREWADLQARGKL